MRQRTFAVLILRVLYTDYMVHCSSAIRSRWTSCAVFPSEEPGTSVARLIAPESTFWVNGKGLHMKCRGQADEESGSIQ